MAIAICEATITTLGCAGGSPDPEPSVEAPPAALAAACDAVSSTRRFFIPPANPAALAQITDLVHHRDFRNALRLTEMEATPMAVWFTGGTPDDVESAVRSTMAAAAHQRRVPVLVSYNVPFRDCAQYSAGGATDTGAYEAWIDAFARGIGDREAVVILEPDALGIIPYNTALNGTAEWCKPTITDAAGNVTPAPGASPAERYAQLNYAVDALKAKAPNATTYLDGTHTAWLSSGDAAYRLVTAGVARAGGFFLDVSNYQPTPQLTQYGTWISKCIYYANNPAEGGWRLGHYDYCASQYYPANSQDYSTWALTDQWYADNVDLAANPPSGPSALTHFVIDTSRNGQGPMNAAVYGAAPFDQPASVVAGLSAGNWCNAKGAGLGLRPTAATGVPLVDAYLWVKIPGESDGSCDIAGGARAWDYTQYNPWCVVEGDAQTHFDPLWGQVDPAAGQWFADQALELATDANPPLFP
jgi:endoglucanase